MFVSSCFHRCTKVVFPSRKKKKQTPHLDTVKMNNLCSVALSSINLFNKTRLVVYCLRYFALGAYALSTAQINRDFREDYKIREEGDNLCVWSALPPKHHRVINPQLQCTVTPTKQLCHHNPRELRGGSIPSFSQPKPQLHTQTHTNTHTQVFCGVLHWYYLNACCLFHRSRKLSVAHTSNPPYIQKNTYCIYVSM